MALASVGVGLAGSWVVLDPPVLGTVLTGELLAVVAIAVLPLLSFALLRRGHRREESVEEPPAPRGRSAWARVAAERSRRSWSREPTRPRTHAPARAPARR
jgi:hypothetical protein